LSDELKKSPAAYLKLAQTQPFANNTRRYGVEVGDDAKALGLTACVGPRPKKAVRCVSGWFRLLLCGVSGDLLVGAGLLLGAEAEEGLEGGHRGAAAVVAKDVLVEVDL
jgi:hypothetical protein